jgi:poly(A) polymerase Pap1
MRIFTPAFPNINSSFKVNLLTFKTIGKELFRGVDILESETLTDN